MSFIRLVKRIVETFVLEVFAIFKYSPTSMPTLSGFVAGFWDLIMR